MQDNPDFKARVIVLLKYLSVGPALVLIGSFFGAGMLDGVAGSSQPGHPIGYFFVVIGMFVTAVVCVSVLIFSIIDAFLNQKRDKRFLYAPFIYILVIYGLYYYLPQLNYAIARSVT